MRTLYEHIGELRREWAGRRQGWYMGIVSHAAQSYRRVQIKPSWLEEGAIDHVRRISSPILDVLPTDKARLAILSEDGDPDRAAWIGEVWDNARAAMTVWLRANLSAEPGRLEIGSARSIHIRLATAEDDPSAAFTLTPLPDGAIHIETQGAKLILSQSGQVYVGSHGVDLVAQVASLCTQVDALCTQLAATQVATALGPQPLSTAAAITAIKALVVVIKGQIDTITT